MSRQVRYECGRGHEFESDAVSVKLICPSCLTESVEFADVAPVDAHVAASLLADVVDPRRLEAVSARLRRLEWSTLPTDVRKTIILHEFMSGTLHVVDGGRLTVDVYALDRPEPEGPILICASALATPRETPRPQTRPLTEA